jgi:cytochrome o ubiquinol oxidase subunit 2
MNSFFVPQLGSQIYAMGGMATRLVLQADRPGTYVGRSVQYSGAGFSDMRFKFLGLSDADYAKWVATNKQAGQALSRANYLKLEQPSTKEPVRRYASVEQGLYDAILNRCVDGKKMCIHQMMTIDKNGGAGKGAVEGVMEQDLGAGRKRTVVAALCTPSNPGGLPVAAARARP